MAVFASPSGGYVWPDGSVQSLAPPSQPLGTIVDGSVQLIGDRPISYHRLYRTQPWVAAAVHLLQRQTARLPLQTFIPDPDGDDAAYNRKRTRDHPLAVVLRRPQPRRSPLDLKAEIMLGLAVQGNHLEEIIRDRPGGVPIGLERIDWRTAKPRLSSDGMRVMQWDITPLGGGPMRRMMPEDVLHFRWPSPDGPIGVSPLQQLGVTVRSEDAAQRYAASSMRHGGMHGVAVRIAKEYATDEEVIETIRHEVMDRSGPDRANLPYILGGIEAVDKMPVQTAVEAELINQRKVNREEIAAVYGTPPVLIGDLSHATYSNVSEMHGMLYVTILGPWLSLIAEQLDAQLVQPEPNWAFDGVWAEWSLDEVLKGDTKARMEAYLIGLRAGALTINDIRRKENLPPFADPRADEPLIQTNNVAPLSTIGNETDGQPSEQAKELASALSVDPGLAKALDALAEALTERREPVAA
jgi:HK97 family phage portal protein